MVAAKQTMKTRNSMNEEIIVTSYVVTDDSLKAFGHTSHVLASLSDAEVVWVAIMAAMYFQNHHERTLFVLKGMGYLSKGLSVSRFNRRLHGLEDWLPGILTVLGSVFADNDVFVMDSLPVPVCKRVRARRCRKVRGRDYCGYCAAKDEKFFGWRLHLVCTPDGLPATFDLLPAAYHDLTPVHELTVALPSGARVFADKGYIDKKTAASILKDTGVRLIAKPRRNMRPLDWIDEYDLDHFRRRIETINSQLESMGIERLHARTSAGFEIKVHASLLALSFINLN
jgi:hypothetical protein